MLVIYWQNKKTKKTDALHIGKLNPVMLLRDFREDYGKEYYFWLGKI